MNVAQAALELQVALKTVRDMRVHTDLAATVDPPALVIGPPALTWAGHGDGPNLATFIVYVIVPADERAPERLWELVPTVAAALENYPDADITVSQANPGRWPGGGGDLPAYEVITEVAL